jgi:hypothetical protein
MKIQLLFHIFLTPLMLDHNLIDDLNVNLMMTTKDNNNNNHGKRMEEGTMLVESIANTAVHLLCSLLNDQKAHTSVSCLLCLCNRSSFNQAPGDPIGFQGRAAVVDFSRLFLP